MGTDYQKPKMDPGAMEIPYPRDKRTRTCFRCGMPWYTGEMRKIGDSEGKYVCIPCFDRPYGQDQHKRGDYR